MNASRFVIAAVLAAAVSVPQAAAQSQTRPEILQPEEMFEALRKLMDEMKPHIGDAMKMMQEFEHLDDPRHYHLPEVLENGDIIIRRREEAPEFKRDGADEQEPGIGKGIRT
ncbi:MAG: hypothetical protein AAF439_12595 [Pseudomonadota bacterium]